MRLEYAKACKGPALHDALVAAGIAVERVETPATPTPSPPTWVTVPDGTDPAAVQAVVDAHDPAALSGTEQQAQQDTTELTTLRDQYQAMLDAIQQSLDALPAGGLGFDLLTGVQRTDLVRGLLVRQRRLLRAVRVLARRQGVG